MNLNLLFGYQKTTSATGAGNAAGNTFQATGPPADMSSFKVGQTIQGEVVAAKNNEVILQLEDGSQISAKLTKNMQISIGQTMTFEVKSNNGLRLSLSPLYENIGHDPNALKALGAAGMPSNARNLEMVSLLMQKGLPVDKNSLLSFNRQMTANPSTSPAALAQMNRLEIPTTPENIRQFEAYKNYEHQISEAVRDITDGLIKDIGQMAVKGESESAVALFKQVLSIFGQNNEAANLTANMSGTSQANVTSFVSNVSQANGTLQASIPNQAAMITGDDIVRMIGGTSQAREASLVGDTTGTSPLTDAAQGSAAGAAKILENLPLDKQVSVQNLTSNPAAINQDAALNMNNAASIQTTTSDAVFMSLLELAPENREQLANLLREAGFSNELTNAVNDANISQTTLVSMLNQELLQKSGLIDNSKLAALLNHKDFQAIIKNDINSQWLMKPEDVSKDFVEEHIKKIFEQTNKLVATLNFAGRGETSVAASANNLSNNINFVNQLNQMFTYIQLPLKMNGENTHAELFVYTNKKNLAKNDGNVSALLHLDMEHLGPMDIYVAMQNQKVSTKFYLASDRMIDLVEKHIDVLNDRLIQRGYSMTSDFVAREPDKRPIDEMMEATSNVSILSSYSFDARA